MRATDILMSEHRVIERVLALLQTAAQRLEQGNGVRPGFFLDATDFFKGLVDGCHGKKEESVLFKAMADYGMPTHGGPIPVMLAEHEQGRVFTHALRAAAQKLESGDGAARSEVARNAYGLAALFQQHILKEDRILFPMAHQVIPPSRQEQVAEDFEHVEHEETGEGVHEKYLALVVALEKEVQEA